MQTFRIVKPAPALAPYIRYYWILRDDALTPVSERTLPVGCMQLVFHKGRQLVSLQNSQLTTIFYLRSVFRLFRRYVDGND